MKLTFKSGLPSEMWVALTHSVEELNRTKRPASLSKKEFTSRLSLDFICIIHSPGLKPSGPHRKFGLDSLPNSDYKLDFGNSQGKTSETWHGGIATIFQSPGDEVWGVVWKMNKSNLSSLDKQEGVKSGTYVPIEVNVYTQEGKEITCRSYQMKNYESALPSLQYKKVICLGAKENDLPLEYQKKLNAVEPNDYQGEVSEEIEDIIKKGETKVH
ncbi:gamma-glutamylcyclotransferase isoform X2 [Leptonychotes weddellii]|nr:gamma-glutamylcyclotransferase isoform X2 [Leptonychotes weddellii]